MATLIFVVIWVIVACVVGGALTWLVRTAPFVPEPIKATVVWVIWAVIVILLLLWLVSAMGGGNARFPFWQTR